MIDPVCTTEAFYVHCIYIGYPSHCFDNLVDAKKYADAMIGMGAPRVEIECRKSIIIDNPERLSRVTKEDASFPD